MMTTCSSHLRSSAALILILHSFTALSQMDHDFFYFVGCFYNGTTQVLYEFDGEEVMYADFEKSDIVYTIPDFVVFDPSTVFDQQHVLKNALKAKRACVPLMTYVTKEMAHPPEEQDPPETLLYTALEVHRGVENRLICFVNHFFPPFVKITWAKNNHIVSEGVSVSQYHVDNDHTFNLMSTLTITPWEGDIYSCTVEHAALESPKTTLWEPEFSHSRVDFDIFCGVGLSFGLLGVATGTFLIIKALQDS